ncbi:hypothetical protein EG327_001586 [Venturia inaequalis]|uniref:Uncharacterized protein n=1 Tax=Venturia inaequalis TaxID=5025 RepID=A0A8H3VHM5_VENIN|nr:hypothetical protein EG327_001586 [Venturia inaequalis]
MGTAQSKPEPSPQSKKKHTARPPPNAKSEQETLAQMVERIRAANAREEKADRKRKAKAMKAKLDIPSLLSPSLASASASGPLGFQSQVLEMYAARSQLLQREVNRMADTIAELERSGDVH